jgi:hypothetical protein
VWPITIAVATPEETVVVVIMVTILESIGKAVADDVEGLGKKQEKGGSRQSTGGKHRNNDVDPETSGGRIGVPSLANCLTEPVSRDNKGSRESGDIDEERYKNDFAPGFGSIVVIIMVIVVIVVIIVIIVIVVLLTVDHHGLFRSLTFTVSQGLDIGAEDIPFHAGTLRHESKHFEACGLVLKGTGCGRCGQRRQGRHRIHREHQYKRYQDGNRRLSVTVHA